MATALAAPAAPARSPIEQRRTTVPFAAKESPAVETPASDAEPPNTLPMPARRSAEARQRTLRRDLHCITADGTCYNLMVGLGETYLSAYILNLGMGEVASGLLSATPMLAGAVLQLASPWGIVRLRSHRAWVVLCAIIQASGLLLLLLASYLTSIAGATVFVAATLYWAGALGAAPAWNTWIEAALPAAIRAPFFARRARLTQAGTFIGFLSGGFALHWGVSHGQATAAFIGMFIAAASFRFLSAWFLSIQSEPLAAKCPHRGCLRELAARFHRDSASRIVIYLMAVQIAVYFSGPYFAPFMLRQLHFTFYDYTCLIGMTYFCKVLCSPLWGRMARRYGSRGLLWIGGVGIVPVAGMWLFSDNYWYLLGVQAVAGITWSAYELAMVLVFLDAIPRGQRTSLLTLYNLGNASAQVLGALLGGWLLAHWGEQYFAYHWLFGLSSCGRLAALSLLLLATRAAAAGRAERVADEEAPALAMPTRRAA
jgi:hypothetical protein